jgi:hypothetical protein
MAGRVNDSDKKMTSGCAAFTSAMIRCQNGNGLVCGLSTRNAVTPWSIQTWKTRRIAA